ncbi:sigma factor [Brucellaceae bacterium C25G]
MGNSKAEQLELLYRAERIRLERVASRAVGSSGAADVVQDMFTTIWAKAKEHVMLTPSYLIQATKYTAISHFRSERRR